MGIDKFYIFNLVSDILIQEKFGRFVITIKPDSLCKFDQISPTNKVHRHDYYELCFVIEETGEYLHGDKLYNLNKGDIFICNPLIEHEIRLKASINGTYSSELYLIFFVITLDYIHAISPTHFPSIEEKILHSFTQQHEIVVHHCDHMFSYIDFLMNHIGPNTLNNYGIYNMMKTIAFEGLSLLCSSQNSHPLDANRYPSEFNQLLMFIESNLNKPITIQDLANASYMSHRNLHYLFNKYVHKTPKEYINTRKINLAKLYLRMNYKVGEVALLVGIQDVGQFSRLFKKQCGISPKGFRQSKVS